MKKTVLSLLVSATVLLSLNAFASAPISKEKEFEDKINATGLYKQYGNVQVVRSLAEFGLPDLYEVKIGGRDYGIMPSSGTHFITGEVVHFVKDQQPKNITAEYKSQLLALTAKEEVAKLKEADFISYAPKVEKLGTLYVFTDTTCGYCVKLHTEVEKYQAAGIEVKYIPYPRSGVEEKVPVAQNPDGSLQYGNNEALEHLAQTMCAKDKGLALTEFKRQVAGLKYDTPEYQQKKAECISYVKEGYAAGQKIGFSGTPFLYLSTGEVIPGYNPAEQVVEKFKAAKK